MINEILTIIIRFASFSLFPDEVLCRVFQYLDTSDLLRCSCVCKRWKCVANIEYVEFFIHVSVLFFREVAIQGSVGNKLLRKSKNVLGKRPKKIFIKEAAISRSLTTNGLV